MSRMRIGIIGAGNMGRAHARAYRENARACAFADEFAIELSQSPSETTWQSGHRILDSAESRPSRLTRPLLEPVS